MMQRSPHSPPPILVTGAERTGTTWVGNMLSASLFGWRDFSLLKRVSVLPSQQAIYLSEAFNVDNRCLWMEPPVPYWCFYICAENAEPHSTALAHAFRFKYPFRKIFAVARPYRTLRNQLLEWARFQQGKAFQNRPLLKDPGALFSAPWLAKRFDAQVVITIRHPLAFASSRKRLNWPVRLADWLAQPLLTRDLIGPYVEEIQRSIHAAEQGKADTIDLACLYWKVAYRVVAQFRETHPDFILARHEDLSLDPLPAFRALYRQLGLAFTTGAEKRIRVSSTAGNPGEAAHNEPHRIRLDSRANLQNWKHRLTPDEIRRIRQATEETASLFYEPDDWA